MRNWIKFFIAVVMIYNSTHAMQKIRTHPSKKVAIALLAMAILVQQQQVEAPAVLIPAIRPVPDSIPSTLSYATHHALMQSMHEQHFLRGDSAMVAIGKIMVLGVCASLFVSFCFPS